MKAIVIDAVELEALKLARVGRPRALLARLQEQIDRQKRLGVNGDWTLIADLQEAIHAILGEPPPQLGDAIRIVTGDRGKP